MFLKTYFFTTVENLLRELAQKNPDDFGLIYIIDYNFSKLNKIGLHCGDIASQTGIDKKVIEETFKKIKKNYCKKFDIKKDGGRVILVVRSYFDKKVIKKTFKKTKKNYDKKFDIKKDEDRVILVVKSYFDKKVIKETFKKIKENYDKKFDIKKDEGRVILSIKSKFNKIGNKKLVNINNKSQYRNIISIIDYYFSKITRSTLNSVYLSSITGFSEKRIKDTFNIIFKDSPDKFDVEYVEDHMVLSKRSLFNYGLLDILIWKLKVYIRNNKVKPDILRRKLLNKKLLKILTSIFKITSGILAIGINRLIFMKFLNRLIEALWKKKFPLIPFFFIEIIWNVFVTNLLFGRKTLKKYIFEVPVKCAFKLKYIFSKTTDFDISCKEYVKWARNANINNVVCELLKSKEVSLKSEESKIQNYHLISNDGKWIFKKEKSEESIQIFENKMKAMKFCTKYMKENGGSLKVHKRNGQFQEERTYPSNKDPIKSKG